MAILAFSGFFAECLEIHPAMNAKTSQIYTALMTNQNVDDASVLQELLAQIPADIPIDTAGGDDAYDKKPCLARMAAREEARLSIPPRGSAAPWSQGTRGASWRDDTIETLARSSRREWKVCSGYQRRSLAENVPARNADGP